ncbi:hypothetical protein EYF80_017001 [Liparis tanakae]|uniref:Uncharacterized protein n=1 Tax=Liparis tanakae TaxID=230148 RepID=A0A4Z2I407_9TELE|nr:hypothetical protein EYF80_017001 [Liparis tanakae]
MVNRSMTHTCPKIGPAGRVTVGFTASSNTKMLCVCCRRRLQKAAALSFPVSPCVFPADLTQLLHRQRIRTEATSCPRSTPQHPDLKLPAQRRLGGTEPECF